MARTRSLEALFASSILCVACGTSTPSATTFAVTYDGNGSTGGAVPVDASRYSQGQTVTVLGNTGSLVDTGHVFSGWNTAASGSGTAYLAGATFTMGAADVTLYAHWTTSGGSLSVTYDGNGAPGGAVPVDPGGYYSNQVVTVLGNSGSLVYTGYKFVGWQTKADGSGTTYAPGQTFHLGSTSVTLHALWAGGYAYVVNHNDGGEGGISQFWIGPSGALTPMFKRVVDSSGTDPRFLAADPSGNCIYVSNINANKVGQLTIGADGQLTAMTPATVAESTYPQGIAVHPSGDYVYIGNSLSGNVSQYTTGATGALTPMTPATVAVSGASMAPNLVKVHPSGKYVYVSGGGGHAIAQYTVGNDGTLTALSPATVQAGSNAYAIAFATNAAGDFVYVTNYDTGAVWEYKVQADGTLSSIGTFSTGATYAFFIAVHPSSKWAYVGTLAGTPNTVIAQLNIGSDGTLSSMATPSVSAGGVAAVGLAIEASGKYLYSTSGESGWGGSSVSQFTIDQTTGALTLMANPIVGTGAVGPSEIVTVGN